MRIKDIAEALNLSISTVSKAITGAFDVSETTRQLVLNYVKECGYQTKEERKISKHRRRICILFDNMNLNAQGNIFYPLATSFSTEATANNCEVVIEALSIRNKQHRRNNKPLIIMLTTLLSLFIAVTILIKCGYLDKKEE